MDIFEKLSIIILPILITAFFASIIPRKLKERQGFNEASDKFYATFTKQLNFLEHNVNSDTGDTSNIGEYLRAHYVGTHLNAFSTFRNSLPGRRRKAIDRAWKEYCDFNQYSDKNNQEAMRALALKNLENVLKFAKHK
ncbi:MAG: hypothetical protein GY846_08950 [Deltaproteobacteria bacterium]|nr:hypothetical protein [Deltaproteobacteria bacterium]